MTGTLYVCGTPIGNLKDATFRLVEILGEVDAIACEDTRRAGKLLSHYGIRKPLLSLYRQVEGSRTAKVLALLEAGKSVAYVSDAGMPAISDPGAYLVKEARARGIKVSLVPGPCSVSGALALSGFPADRFVFGGFPPRRSRKRIAFFEEWVSKGVTAVFFESPHRLKDAVADLAEAVPSCSLCLCHEMTKIHEGCMSGAVQDVARGLETTRILGEWVLIVRDE